MDRRWLAAGLALVLAASPVVLADHLGEETCDGLSPIANDCEGESSFRIGKHAQPFVTVLGAFVGEVTIHLTETGDGHDQVHWRCNILLDPTLPAPLSRCSDPSGKPPWDQRVTLHCDAAVYTFEFLIVEQKVAGPAGAWTCGVRI